MKILFAIFLSCLRGRVEEVIGWGSGAAPSIAGWVLRDLTGLPHLW